MFSRFFINRPIFAAVISIIVVLAGLIAIKELPVQEYPSIVPPQISVQAVYPGQMPRLCRKQLPHRSKSR